MKIKQLIHILSSLPQDMEVIIAKDPEWNGFHVANCVDLAYTPSLNKYIIDEISTQSEAEENKQELNCVIISP